MIFDISIFEDILKDCWDLIDYFKLGIVNDINDIHDKFY
jgi:hypothetical protein